MNNLCATSKYHKHMGVKTRNYKNGRGKKPLRYTFSSTLYT